MTERCRTRSHQPNATVVSATALLLLVAALPAVPGQGPIHVDPGDPNAHASLAAALADADPGDTILVAPGAYAGGTTIDVRGVTVRAADPADPPAFDGGGGTAALAVQAPNVTLVDLEVGNATVGVAASGADGLVLSEVEVRDATGDGLRIESTDGARIRGTRIAGVGGNGLLASGSSNMAIENVTVASAGRGVHLRGVAGARLDAIRVNGTANDGIVAEDVTGLTLSNVTERDVAVGIWILDASRVRVEDATIRETRLHGMVVESSEDVVADDVQAGGQFGIWVDASRNVTLRRPNPVDTVGDGIRVEASRDVAIADANVTGSAVNGIFVMNGSVGVEVVDGTIVGERRGVHVRSSHGVAIDGLDVTSAEENGIVVEDAADVAVADATVREANVGLWALRSERVSFRNVTVDEPHLEGVLVDASRNVTVADANVTGGDDVGLQVRSGSRRVDVLGGRFAGNHRGIHLLGVSDVTVDGVTVRDAANDGIVVEDATDVAVRSARIRDVNLGVWARGPAGPANLTVADSDIGRARIGGISLSHGHQGALIEDNLIHDSHRGIKFTDGAPDAPTDGNRLVGNVLTDNDFHIWSDDTHGVNEIRGGRLDDAARCDVWIEGTGGVALDGVRAGAFLTTNDTSAVTLRNADAELTDCVTEAKALDDHPCDPDEWHFVVTDIGDGDAPDLIRVTWADGSTEEVPLDRVTGQVAHYTTTSNLGSTVREATAFVSGGWDGQFNLSHGPCQGADGDDEQDDDQDDGGDADDASDDDDDGPGEAGEDEDGEGDTDDEDERADDQDDEDEEDG